MRTITDSVKMILKEKTAEDPITMILTKKEAEAPVTERMTKKMNGRYGSQKSLCQRLKK